MLGGRTGGADGGGQANVSKHLQLLFQQGFVGRRKEGTTTWYRITDPQVFTMCELVCGGWRRSSTGSASSSAGGGSA